MTPVYYIPNDENKFSENLKTQGIVGRILKQYPVQPEEPVRQALQPAFKPPATPTVYRNGIVWVGGQTMKAITDTLGLSPAAGLYIPPARALGLTHIVTGPLREAIGDALREGRRLVIVRHDPGQPLSESIGLARHELFHASEQWMGNADRGKQLLDDPLAARAAEALHKMGYSDGPP